jgi:hypothetical protein
MLMASFAGGLFVRQYPIFNPCACPTISDKDKKTETSLISNILLEKPKRDQGKRGGEREFGDNTLDT